MHSMLSILDQCNKEKNQAPQTRQNGLHDMFYFAKCILKKYILVAWHRKGKTQIHCRESTPTYHKTNSLPNLENQTLKYVMTKVENLLGNKNLA